VLSQGTALATAFNDMTSRLDDSRHEADLQIRSTVDDINSLTAQIAALNRTPGVRDSALTVRDDQNQMVESLAKLANITVVDRPEGGVDIYLGGGQPLIVGETSYVITKTATPPSGLTALSLQGTTITSLVTGGKLGGLLQVRDVSVPAYQTQLDQLADGVVQQ